jgi:hypothetical protein
MFLEEKTKEIIWLGWLPDYFGQVLPVQGRC